MKFRLLYPDSWSGILLSPSDAEHTLGHSSWAVVFTVILRDRGRYSHRQAVQGTCRVGTWRMDTLLRAGQDFLMLLVAQHGLRGGATSFSEPTRRTVSSLRENRGQLTRDLLPPTVAADPDD